MKKITKIMSICGMCSLLFLLSGCASFERDIKSWKSEFKGLNRKVEIYSDDGVLLKTYEGQMDIEQDEYKTLFDVNGKRYIIKGGVHIIEEQ